MEDNEYKEPVKIKKEIKNVPTCPNCGFELNQRGTCPQCGFCGG